MPPTRPHPSALRALSRFTQPNLRTIYIPGPRLLRQPQHSPNPRLFSSSFQRFNSPADHSPKKSDPSKLVEQPESPQPPTPGRRDQPSYDISFTCEPCSTRSTHRITKQAYHHGSTLITCPSCKNRHVISDHLNVSAFSQEKRCGWNEPSLRS
jgi:protein import protein ZIM17